jgi:hypothetical protein
MSNNNKQLELKVAFKEMSTDWLKLNFKGYPYETAKLFLETCLESLVEIQNLDSNLTIPTITGKHINLCQSL